VEQLSTEFVLSEGKFSISQPAFRCKYHMSILVFIPSFLIMLLQEPHLDTHDVFRLGLLAVNIDHRHHSIKSRSRTLGSETIITFFMSRGCAVVRNSLSRSGRSRFQSWPCYRLILLPKFTYLRVVIDKKENNVLLH